MSKYIILYRKEDTRSVARQLRDLLGSRYGDEKVLLGPDDLGQSPDSVRKSIREAHVLVMPIGDSWLQNPWAADENDLYHIALKAAIEAQRPTLLVRVDDMNLPTLPHHLQGFAPLQSVGVRVDSFREGVDKIVTLLENPSTLTAPSVAPPESPKVESRPPAPVPSSEAKSSAVKSEPPKSEPPKSAPIVPPLKTEPPKSEPPKTAPPPLLTETPLDHDPHPPQVSPPPPAMVEPPKGAPSQETPPPPPVSDSAPPATKPAQPTPPVPTKPHQAPQAVASPRPPAPDLTMMDTPSAEAINNGAVPTNMEGWDAKAEAPTMQLGHDRAAAPPQPPPAIPRPDTVQSAYTPPLGTPSPFSGAPQPANQPSWAAAAPSYPPQAGMPQYPPQNYAPVAPVYGGPSQGRSIQLSYMTRALGFPLQASDGLPKLLIAVLLLLVPLVGWMIVLGYTLRAADEIKNGSDGLPDWDDWQTDLMAGAIAFLGLFLISSPLWLIAIGLGIVMGGSFAASLGYIFLAAIFNIMVVLLGVSTYAEFIQTESLRSFFRLGTIWKKSFGSFNESGSLIISVALYALMSYVLFVIGIFVFVIPAIIVWAYVTLGAAYLIGQWAKTTENLPTTRPMPQPQYGGGYSPQPPYGQGQPPTPPYGTQSPYGQPPTPPYGQQPPYQQPPYGGGQQPPYPPQR